MFCTKRATALLSAVGVLLSLGGCATNPVTGESDFVLISEDQELSLGRQSNQEVLKEYGVYEDPALQAYVQRVGDQLAESSHRSQLLYRFTVLDSDEVNAFALPGGYIYITRGLLAYLTTEDQLAAVLGHEIGHVTARHSVRQYTATQAANIGYGIGSILVPELRGSAGQNLFNVLGTSLIRGYGRSHELEADRLGAEYLARTGRDPNAMLQVLTTLKNQEIFETEKAKKEHREPQVYHGVFSTHPSNDQRLQELIGVVRAQRTDYTAAAPDRFLSYLDGLTYGTSEDQGVQIGSRFMHRKLGFGLRFPAGWRVQNKPDRLVAIPPGNDAILQLTLIDRNRRQSPRQFLADNLKVDGLRDAEDLTINGLAAHTGLAGAGTPWGRRQARYTAVFMDKRAYLFIAATKQDNPAYDALVLNSIRSFHPLSGGERKLAKGLRIKTITAAAGTRYAGLASKSPIPEYPETVLRLINGDYPNGEPAPGRIIKVVY